MQIGASGFEFGHERIAEAGERGLEWREGVGKFVVRESRHVRLAGRVHGNAIAPVVTAPPR